MTGNLVDGYIDDIIGSGVPSQTKINEVIDLAQKGDIPDAELDELIKRLQLDGNDALEDAAVQLKRTQTNRLIGGTGEFIDEALEADYQKYVQRKISEGKTPRDRADWKEASDYWKYDSPMARGNAFNKTAVENDWYPYHEVHLEDGYRLDSYDDVAGEIISRKATDLGNVQLSTFEGYLKEMQKKYSPDSIIRSNKYPDLDGEPLVGKQILEIPASNQSLSNIQEYIDLAKNKYGIELRFKGE